MVSEWRQWHFCICICFYIFVFVFVFTTYHDLILINTSCVKLECVLAGIDGHTHRSHCCHCLMFNVYPSLSMFIRVYQCLSEFKRPIDATTFVKTDLLQIWFTAWSNIGPRLDCGAYVGGVELARPVHRLRSSWWQIDAHCIVHCTRT